MKQLKYKTDDAGHIVVQDGKPLVINVDTGDEELLDINQLLSHIGDLGKEAKKRRETNKTLTEKLHTLEEAGITLDDLPNFVSKVKEVEAVKPKLQGEVEVIRKQWADEKVQLEGKMKALETKLEQNAIQAAFNSSSYFHGRNAKTVLPAALAYKVLGDRFKYDKEEQRLVATDSKGESLYSSKNPELLATFDEAMEMFLKEEPFKDLMKFNGASGAGSVSGNNGINSKQSEIALAHQEAVKTGDVSQLIKSKVKI